jgi:hypothetical protein
LFLGRSVLAMENVWLGGRASSLGVWADGTDGVWADGSAWDFTNWQKGNPGPEENICVFYEQR